MQQQMYLHHDPSGKIKRFHSFTVDQINVDGFLQNSLNFFGSDAFKQLPNQMYFLLMILPTVSTKD
jgi:hypothetical protein